MGPEAREAREAEGLAPVPMTEEGRAVGRDHSGLQSVRVCMGDPDNFLRKKKIH